MSGYSLPDVRARARLMEIADLMQPGWEASEKAINELAAHPGADFEKRQKEIQDDYWNTVVQPHVDEIAALTNNSTSTLASVFRPRPSVLDLGGVLPSILRRIANGSGSWRK
jgi:hypothetical protein